LCKIDGSLPHLQYPPPVLILSMLLWLYKQINPSPSHVEMIRNVIIFKVRICKCLAERPACWTTLSLLSATAYPIYWSCVLYWRPFLLPQYKDALCSDDRTQVSGRLFYMAARITTKRSVKCFNALPVYKYVILNVYYGITILKNSIEN
jgi:hypothetical protein